MVPPPPTEDELAIKEGWYIDDYDGALEEAKKQGKPLFIDFTGIYCANCRVMERRIFPLEKIKNHFDNMVLALPKDLLRREHLQNTTFNKPLMYVAVKKGEVDPIEWVINQYPELINISFKVFSR